LYEEGSSKGSLEYKVGLGGAELELKNSASIYVEKTNDDETNYFNFSEGNKIGITPNGIDLKTKKGFDVVSYENKDGFQARIGVNLETGGSIGEDGVEVKFLGFGFSLSKKNGISFGVGEISGKNDDCVVQ
jgi:hypothetical protein